MPRKNGAQRAKQDDTTTIKELALIGVRQRLQELDAERARMQELAQLLRGAGESTKAKRVKWTKAMRAAAAERMRKLRAAQRKENGE